MIRRIKTFGWMALALAIAAPLGAQSNLLVGNLSVQGGIAFTATGNISAAGSAVTFPANTTSSAGTAPITEFQIRSNTASAERGIMSVQYSADTLGAQFVGRKARGTFNLPSLVSSGDYLAAFVAEGLDGISYLPVAAIKMRAAGTPALTSVPTRIEFHTSTNATPSVLTLAMYIDEAQALVGNSSGLTLKSGASGNNITANTQEGYISILDGTLSNSNVNITLGRQNTVSNYGLITTTSGATGGLRLGTGAQDTGITLAPNRNANVTIANGKLIFPDNATEASYIRLGSFTSGSAKALISTTAACTNGMGFMLNDSEKMTLTTTGLTLVGSLTTNLGAQTAGAADSGGAGFKVVRVPN